MTACPGLKASSTVALEITKLCVVKLGSLEHPLLSFSTWEMRMTEKVGSCFLSSYFKGILLAGSIRSDGGHLSDIISDLEG